MILKISYNNGTSKSFTIGRFDIMPTPTSAPIHLDAQQGPNNIINVNLTASVVPDKTFLEKIEILPS